MKRGLIMKHYLESAEDVLKEVNSTEDGLSSEEAAARLEKHGKNKFAENFIPKVKTDKKQSENISKF